MWNREYADLFLILGERPNVEQGIRRFIFDFRTPR